MAAGLGFKDFTTGEVLTAADVDGYLMQGIWVFASAAARDAAVTSPQEGNACYLKDTNQVLTYSGSAWVAVGGGSPLTTKGDLYTFSTVDARLGVGANGTTLVADSSTATGLKWAAAGGGYTLLSTINASAATSISFTSIPATYKHLFLVWTDCFSPSGAASGYWAARLNNDSGNNYYGQSFNNTPTSVNVSAASSFGAAANASPIGGTNSTALNADNSNGFMWVYDYVNGGKTTVHYEATGENAVIGNCRLFNGLYNGSAAIDRLDLIRSSTNTLTGTLKLYGVS